MTILEKPESNIILKSFIQFGEGEPSNEIAQKLEEEMGEKLVENPGSI